MSVLDFLDYEQEDSLDDFLSVDVTPEDLPAYQQLANAPREISLYDFLVESWPIIEPDYDFTPGWHLQAIAEHLEAVEDGEIRRLLICLPPRMTKALDVDTPVPTPDGWKRHGDLRPGDSVFSPSGDPVNVVAVTPHHVGPARRLGLADGSFIDAHGDHLWRTRRTWHTGRAKGYRNQHQSEVRDLPLVTTDQIAATLRVGGVENRFTHRIKNTVAVTTAPVDLPIPPYTLGAWLGDGASVHAQITTSEQDVGILARIRSDGYEVRSHAARMRYGIIGLQAQLRSVGLLGRKHVPQEYLRSSVAQRLDLLRGLIDTDGCHIGGGRYQIVQRSSEIMDGLTELLLSLGIVPRGGKRRARLNGRDVGEVNLIQFGIQVDDPDVATLPRKKWAGRVYTSGRVGMQARTVVSADAIGDRTVNCIQVAAPDGMYLAGRGFVPTHNSILTSICYPAWAWTQRPGRRFMFASYNADLAVEVHAITSRRLMQSDWYQEHWGDQFELVFDQNTKHHYENDRRGFRISSGLTSVTGKGADVLVLDDPHDLEEIDSEVARMSVRRFYRKVWRSRLNDPKRGSQVCIMQRAHEDDLADLLLEEYNYEPLILPNEYDPKRSCLTSIGWSDPRTEEGDLPLSGPPGRSRDRSRAVEARVRDPVQPEPAAGRRPHLQARLLQDSPGVHAPEAD